MNIGPRLAEEIVQPIKGGPEQFFEERNPASMFVREVEKTEIIDVVKHFKNKKSKDWNGIDMYIVKLVINEIIDPFAHIFNLSFMQGSFPDRMKIAKVIPLYKSGEKQLFTNYRPVSLLSQFSKILEKLFVARLDSFIVKCKLLSRANMGLEMVDLLQWP